jgi:hypothetical protein
MCVYESESEREEREGSTRENNFVHGKLLAGIHRGREREKLLVGIQGAAIHSVEREGGRGEKVGFCF